MLIAGGIDLSFGSILASCAIIAAWLQPHGFLLPIVAALLLGALLGLINGLLVAKIDANPLITTLGTQWLYLSLLFIITDGRLVQGTTDNAFHLIGHGKLFGVPVPIYLLLGAIGGNEDACRMLGIKVDRYRILFFVLSGLSASFGCVVLSSKINAASAVFGENIALVVIAAIVLGGVHLSGGVGTVAGVVQGVLLLGLLEKMTIYLGLYGYYQMFFQSLLLISVVVFDVLYIKYGRWKLENEELARNRTAARTA